MRIVASNSNETKLLAAAKTGMRFYCPTTGNIFDASPCENCGEMSAHGGSIVIEGIDAALHNALTQVFRVLEFNEVVGIDDDGNEHCEAC